MTQKWRIEYTNELKSGWRIFAENGYEEMDSNDVVYVIKLLEADQRANFLEWQLERILDCHTLDGATGLAWDALRKVDEQRALINKQLEGKQ